jgi:thymidylate kinase
MSKLIVFEGADRVGKATQSEMFCDYINNILKKKACLVEVPIHDNLTYRPIYWMLKSGLAKKLPKTFQWLQCLNRWIFQTFKLVKLEHQFDYIVFDRWSPSTSVYGRAEGLSRDYVESMYRRLRVPDAVVVLSGKSHRHEAEDVYERDSGLQRRVRVLYEDWVIENSSIACVVSCEGTKESVSREVVSCLTRLGVVTA